MARNNAEILSANVCSGDSKSLAIDARTGEIFTVFQPNQLECGKDFDARMQQEQDCDAPLLEHLGDLFYTAAGAV